MIGVLKEMNINFASNENFLSWNDFSDRGKSYTTEVFVHRTENDPAIYLHSGGTTGTPKNIVLTNGNVNSTKFLNVVVFQ